MQIEKSQIVDLLRSQGDEEKADKADQELPAMIDTDLNADLLADLGIDPSDVAGKLGGLP